MNNHHIRHLSKWYILLIILVYITTLFVIYQGHHNRLSQQKTIISTQIELSLYDTLRTYESFAKYIYSSELNQPSVLDVMVQANYANAEDQAVLRTRLHTMLLPVYHSIKEFNFNQLHFHLPNGDSFLRFHNINAYGDNLLNYRPLIQEAIETRSYQSGFDIGRSDFGYRFVFPLFYGVDYVGSVEFTLSSKYLLSNMIRLYSDTEIALILHREVAEDIFFDYVLHQLQLSTICEKYLISKDILDFINANPSRISRITDEAFNTALYSQIEPSFVDQSSFTSIFKYQGNNYIVNFQSVVDSDNIHIAYLYSVSLSEPVNLIYAQTNQLILVTTAIMLLMLILYAIIQRQERAISKFAMIDPLTGIYNRGTFTDFAQRLVARQERDKSSISVAIIDIDFFKEINDRFGHKVGDKVIIEVVNVMTNLVRRTDIFARYGGDEFIILFPDTNIDTATCVLERIRRHVEKTIFTKVNHVTISIGVHEKRFFETLDDAIVYADTALYQAKTQGKNKVVETEPSN